MLHAPVPPARLPIPPGFIDFASSSFDAILYPAAIPPTTPISDNQSVQRRSSHLPDLVPFIQLITEKCNILPVHLVMALMYVQRFRNGLPAGYKAEPEAAHRIFVASLLVASKYSDDNCLSTRQVVRAAGDVWSIKEITRMEIGFLCFLHWDLHIHPDEMATFLRNLNFDISLILPSPSLFC
ncbi:cyclin [Phycomyces blakesleeanus]|uniref:Cyclin n=1 Tax=Phycomyces blakesleeanus (strain ATCC 8743b / DSM 1359 / FGSC 10004 / NBRC 33097 / NRRL 1555) TaxID=763407 RepID=A0A167PAC5_PHYB8|nr:cyclin [Phycomyces blakesleeanus NRRL 1555(-)]OAD77564.1 cyclin [Phycomyces blakesleeanus NRRL 1555(-)]|eukprot:XP_018295604.1 cyclin [Phycomyces blakesleeanus NRRL 1555(-)]